MNISHPLALGTKVIAQRRSCACKGAKTLLVEGSILKVITNHSGTWYYLSAGSTVKSDTVTSVVS